MSTACNLRSRIRASDSQSAGEFGVAVPRTQYQGLRTPPDFDSATKSLLLTILYVWLSTTRASYLLKAKLNLVWCSTLLLVGKSRQDKANTNEVTWHINTVHSSQYFLPPWYHSYLQISDTVIGELRRPLLEHYFCRCYRPTTCTRDEINLAPNINQLVGHLWSHCLT